jgi:hypothetical protein
LLGQSNRTIFEMLFTLEGLFVLAPCLFLCVRPLHIHMMKIVTETKKESLLFRLLSIAFLISLAVGVGRAIAQAPPTPPVAGRPVRPTPPIRDPHTSGYVAARELPDGTNAPTNADGNFILGPTHNPAPDMTVREGVPHGMVYEFTMNSADSKIYPGIARASIPLVLSIPLTPANWW